LGKVLTAKDIAKVKSSSWLSKGDVEEENPTLTKSSPPLGRAVAHWWELQGWAGAESSLHVSGPEDLPGWGLGRRKREGPCCWRFHLGCRVSQQMTALSFLFRL